MHMLNRRRVQRPHSAPGAAARQKGLQMDRLIESLRVTRLVANVTVFGDKLEAVTEKLDELEAIVQARDEA